MLDRVIFYSFSALFALTPLIWFPINFELFEYNKMIFVYLLAVIIIGAWLLNMANQKTITIKRTPIDIPILIFLGVNILSTYFSIDFHTSIFGYYSRSNGGLLSIISYTLLFFAFVSNIDKEQAFKILKMGLWGGLVVSLWAIPEHFGISPSCVILRGDLTADCWIQDVQARVFATLGQPNWLGAYLAMLIFPAIYFFLTARTKKQTIIYYLLTVTYYLAFTFTYSRGATLGLIAGIVVLFGFLFFERKREVNSKIIFIILASFLTINLIFGSALTRFQLTQFLPKSSSAPIQTQSPIITQLEAGGTESGTIRLIVWRGALDIFKHYPIFGSGLETFAYSYYQFRPIEHNLVSEWDFLYNKAHNEYLNYLANTGLVGSTTYLILIFTFIWHSLKQKSLFSISLLAAYISYLIQNIFGFSVVITALFFYLFPAIAYVLSDSTKQLIIKLPSLPIRVVKILTFFAIFYLLSSIFIFWYADILFATGEKAIENGNPGKAYNYLSSAVALNEGEPFYRNELGYAAASAAVALSEVDATQSANLKQEAIAETEKVLEKHPKNVSFWRTAIRTYYQLSGLDDTFTQKTLETINQTIKLAPTDPKLYYNKAIILGQIDENEKAIESLNQATALKSNYREGYLALGLFYYDVKEYEKAVESMQKVLLLVPNDPEALDQLNDWGVKP